MKRKLLQALFIVSCVFVIPLLLMGAVSVTPWWMIGQSAVNQGVASFSVPVTASGEMRVDTFLVYHEGNFTPPTYVASAGYASNSDMLDGYHASNFLPAASYTASDVLTKVKTVDGSGSGLDADLLDGYNSGTSGANLVLRTDASGYLTPENWIRVGNLTGLYNANGFYFYPYNQSSYGGWYLRGPSTATAVSLKLQKGTDGTDIGWLYASGFEQGFLSSGGGWRLKVPVSGSILRDTYTMWDSNNDGSGSGLDADLLDGYNVSTTANAASTVPVRDASGYMYLGWINTTSGDNGTTTPSRIYASHDGFIRYYTLANFKSVLGVGTAGSTVKSSGFVSCSSGAVTNLCYLGTGQASNYAISWSWYSSPTNVIYQGLAPGANYYCYYDTSTGYVRFSNSSGVTIYVQAICIKVS